MVEGSVNIRRPILNKEIVTTNGFKIKLWNEVYYWKDIWRFYQSYSYTNKSCFDGFINSLLFKNRTNKRFKDIEKYIKQTGKKETEWK